MENELITIQTREDGVQIVSARDLYNGLEIKTKFADWFKRVCEYGFEEKKDFTVLKNEKGKSGQFASIEYYISIDMAKEICMIQRSDIGRNIGHYLEEIYWKNKLVPSVNVCNDDIYIDTSISSGEITGVNARDLWSKLEINKDFSDWFKQMVSYGFQEGKDFSPFLGKTSEIGRPLKEYAISIDMAKEICMIQRSDIGRKFRQYFIDCEKKLLQSSSNLLNGAEILNALTKNIQILTSASVQNQTEINTLKHDWLDFNSRLSALENKVNKNRVIDAPCKSPRSHINQMVRNYAKAELNNNFPKVWGILYQDFYYRTGISIISESSEKGVKPLDYVDSIGKLQELEATAVELFIK